MKSRTSNYCFLSLCLTLFSAIGFSYGIQLEFGPQNFGLPDGDFVSKAAINAHGTTAYSTNTGAGYQVFIVKPNENKPIDITPPSHLMKNQIINSKDLAYVKIDGEDNVFLAYLPSLPITQLQVLHYDAKCKQWNKLNNGLPGEDILFFNFQINNTGDAVLIWSAPTDATHVAVQMAILKSNSKKWQVSRVFDKGAITRNTFLFCEINSKGEALGLWQAILPGQKQQNIRTVITPKICSGIKFPAPQTVSTIQETKVYGIGVGLDEAGDALCIWSSNANAHIEFNTFSHKRNRWRKKTRHIPHAKSGNLTAVVSLAVDQETGNALAIWNDPEVRETLSCAAFNKSKKRWSNVETLTTTFNTAFANFGLCSAVNLKGEGCVVWLDVSNNQERTRAEAFPNIGRGSIKNRKDLGFLKNSRGGVPVIAVPPFVVKKQEDCHPCDFEKSSSGSSLCNEKEHTHKKEKRTATTLWMGANHLLHSAFFVD